MKLIIKNTIIPSNHQVLYTQIRAVSVLYLLSMKVPVAIAIANARNRKAIKRVENKKATIFLSICKGITFLKSATKVLKNVQFLSWAVVNLIQN